MSPAKRPTALSDASYKRRHYFWDVPSGSVVEQVLDPLFWTNVTGKLAAGVLIEVHPEDLAWWALLIVRGVGSREASVAVLQYVNLSSKVSVAIAASPYEVRFINTARRFGVFLKAGGDLVRDEFQVREHAETYIANHMKAMAN